MGNGEGAEGLNYGIRLTKSPLKDYAFIEVVLDGELAVP